MTIPLCPLRLIAVAADTTDRLKNDAVGIDCPKSDECPWWDSEPEQCAVLSLTYLCNVMRLIRYRDLGL